MTDGMALVGGTTSRVLFERERYCIVIVFFFNVPRISQQRSLNELRKFAMRKERAEIGPETRYVITVLTGLRNTAIRKKTGYRETAFRTT